MHEFFIGPRLAFSLSYILDISLLQGNKGMTHAAILVDIATISPMTSLINREHTLLSIDFYAQQFVFKK